MNRAQKEQLASIELATLMQVMQLNPSCWSQHTVESILDDLEVLAALEIPEAVLSRIERVQRELILPLAEIVTTQSKAVAVERRRSNERERQLKRDLANLEAEKDKAIRRYQEEAAQMANYSQFCEMIIGDLDEMAKAVDRTRLEKKQAEDNLAEVEAEKKQADLKLADLAAEVQRLTCEKDKHVRQSYTYEPSFEALMEGLGTDRKSSSEVSEACSEKVHERRTTTASMSTLGSDRDGPADEDVQPSQSWKLTIWKGIPPCFQAQICNNMSTLFGKVVWKGKPAGKGDFRCLGGGHGQPTNNSGLGLVFRTACGPALLQELVQ